MPTLALVTAVAATGHDDDLLPLLEACQRAGLSVRALAWDDASVSWSRFDAVLLRSPWDYTERLPEFLAWCEQTSRDSRLINPLSVVRWNSDKHYLADLAALGIPVIPTCFVEADAEPLPALQDFLALHPGIEFVLKPAVSAGARDTQRYSADQQFAAGNHLARLLDQDRAALLQPYLAAVDTVGETALVYLGGQFSHAIRKGALLGLDATATLTPLSMGNISPQQADADERALAERALQAMDRLMQLSEPLAYARIDLIRDQAGAPCLLEMELVEPSLFFAHAPGSADLMAENLVNLLANCGAPTRAHHA